MKPQSSNPVVMMVMLPLLFLHELNGCIDREREALLEMKKSIIDKSDCLSSWTGKNCCDWKGVECDVIGHVISLIIPRPQLNAYGHCYISNYIPDTGFTDGGWLGGEINPSLLNLTYLEQLDLSGNIFSGTLPSDIGSLKHLKQLALSQNNFTGPIPTSIGLLLKLEGLAVSYNSFTGTLSELHFAKLARLLSLEMASNKLTINVSHEWVPPFQLTFLNIQSCIVGPEFPSWLQTQTSLTTLNLASTGISDTMPGWFERILPTIENLDLSKNEIRGKVPEIQDSNMHVSLHSNKFESLFKQFPTHVDSIDVSNNLLSGQFPEYYVTPVEKVGPRPFIFANNNLTGPIPEYFCSLKFAIIDLSSNKLSGELNSCFSYSKTLLVLDLSNNSLHGQIPSDFGFMAQSLVTLVMKVKSGCYSLCT